MTATPAERPRLAAGLGAFAIGNAAGEISWVREARGNPSDWGGLYAQGVRLTGPWSTRLLRPDGSEAPWPPVVATTARPGSFRTERADVGLRIVEEVTPHPELPCVSVERRFRRTDGAAGTVSLRTEFEAFLAPVLVEGIRPLELTLESRGAALSLEAGGFVTTLRSEPLASSLSVDGQPWIGGRRRGPLRRIAIGHEVPVPPAGEGTLRILLAGGRKGSAAVSLLPTDSGVWADQSARTVEAWESRAPALSASGDPGLEEGFRRARRALRSLYTQPEPGFTGLLAGYPWYAALWCRDLARMLPAVLWMGDAEWAARSLETVFRFQAPRTYPLLAARVGELPMQVSPGPIFLYGTSDTSLYYPELARRFLRHTGDERRTAGWLKALEGVRAWGEGKLSPGSGLFRNGGEIEEMRAATSAAGRVHVGIDATDTTIWDSADRRDHAVDLQSLWLQVLRALRELSDLPGAPAGWRGLDDRIAAFTGLLSRRYTWSAEGYLFDSLREDGTPVAKLRPNALQWAGLGILDPEAERRLVARASRPDLATDWGVRTLSSGDPEYDPLAYHMGQVWPIATAWLARAAYAVRAADVGAEWLRRCARTLVDEEGFANECYRGDRPEPFDSCFLLGFSVAPFLSAVFEGLWGLAPDARRGVVEVDPQLPSGSPGISLDGLSIGAGRLDLAARPGKLTARWSGPGALVLASPSRSVRLPEGGTGELPLEAQAI